MREEKPVVQLPLKNGPRPTSSAPPFSTYLKPDSFNAPLALKRLISGEKLETGESALLQLAFLCWIVAPRDLRFLLLKVQAAAQGLRKTHIDRLSEKNKTSDHGLMHVIFSGHNSTKWLSQACQFLDRKYDIFEIGANELQRMTASNARHATLAADLVSMVHFHHSGEFDPSRKIKSPSMGRAYKAVAGLLNTHPKTLFAGRLPAARSVTSANSLRTEVWARCRDTSPWIYAISRTPVTSTSKRSILHFFRVRDGEGLGPIRDRWSLVARKAKFVEEEILSSLVRGGNEHIPVFPYPSSIKRKPINPRRFSDEAVKVIISKLKDGRVAESFHPS